MAGDLRVAHFVLATEKQTLTAVRGNILLALTAAT
jgi:hypothetical protein